MKLVRAALGNGVNHSAGRAAVLRRVIRSVHLELANRSLAGYVAKTGAAFFFGEEGLIVIATIDGVVVQQSRNSAEADQAEVTIRDGTWSQQPKIRPARTSDGQVVNFGLIDVT